MWMSRGSVLSRLRTSFENLPTVVRGLVVVQTLLYLFFVLLRLLGMELEVAQHCVFIPPLFLDGTFWTPLTYFWVHVSSDLFGWLFDVVILWTLGGIFARRWRGGHFLFFVVASSILAAGVDLLLYLAIGASFAAAASGMSAGSFALFVAFYYVFGDAPVSVLGSPPMRGRTVFFAIVGLETVLFLAGNNPAFGIQLGGLFSGWLLVTGRWRPAKLGAWVSGLFARFRKDPKSRFRIIN